MSSTDRRGDDQDNAVKALLRSGLRGILAVTVAVILIGGAAAAIALAVALAY